MFHVPLAADIDDLAAVDIDDLIVLHGRVSQLTAEKERQAAKAGHG